MGTFFREVEQSRIDMEDLVELFKAKPKVTNASDAVDFELRTKGEIEFRHVYFGHERDTDNKVAFLLKDFNLKIKPGTSNAIVGPSGFGKTTLLHLIFRNYDPAGGQVLIDGQDLKGLKLESFRKHLCVIP
jgi:ABC-type multidrug transport system fused ATPase/permease subunit